MREIGAMDCLSCSIESASQESKGESRGSDHIIIIICYDARSASGATLAARVKVLVPGAAMALLLVAALLIVRRRREVASAESVPTEEP
jgi:hypothetical protein